MCKYLAVTVVVALLCLVAGAQAEEQRPKEPRGPVVDELADDVIDDLLDDALKAVVDDVICHAQGGHYLGRNYYFETSQKRNRGEANDFCQSIGMNLVDVNDCRENTFIIRFIKAMRCEHEHFWTGGYQDGDNVWYWPGTGAPLSYTNWKVGEPNYGKDAYCIHYRKEYLQWNDEKCSEKYYAVCSTNA